MEGSAAMLAPLALVALGAIYFLPSIIAGSRGHMSAAAIVALNLLLGWTALGWILALVWSLNSNTRENLQYLATGERSSPPTSAPRVIAATPPSSAPGTSVELHLSHLIPAVVLVAVALFGLIGWLVLRAEKRRMRARFRLRRSELRLSMKRPTAPNSSGRRRISTTSTTPSMTSKRTIPGPAASEASVKMAKP
jgi:hypothetical protein